MQYEEVRCQKQLHENYVLRKLQNKSRQPLVNILLMAESSVCRTIDTLGDPEDMTDSELCMYERDTKIAEALRDAIKELDKTLTLGYKDEWVD